MKNKEDLEKLIDEKLTTIQYIATVCEPNNDTAKLIEVLVKQIELIKSEIQKLLPPG